MFSPRQDGSSMGVRRRKGGSFKEVPSVRLAFSWGSFRGNAVGPESTGPYEVCVWAFLVSFCSASAFNGASSGEVGALKGCALQKAAAESPGACWKVQLRWANTHIATFVTDMQFFFFLMRVASRNAQLLTNKLAPHLT